jgi:hypothetical protein
MKRKIFNQKGFSGLATILIIVAILVIVGGAYFVMGKKVITPSASTAGSNAVDKKASSKAEEPLSNVSATFQDVVGKGQNLECDWKLPTEMKNNPFGTGKLYTTGNKGRSMINGNSSGMSIEGNGIYKDGQAYSWVKVGETTVGFKFDQAKLAELSSQMTLQQKQQAEQIRAKMIFSCKPWTPDESMFALPTGVEFK